MTDNPEDKNNSKDEINSLKEELNELKKQQEIELLKAEVASIRTQPSSSSSSQYSDARWDEIKSKRTTTGILGIFFGYFGVHKFILGYKREGFTYLAVSIIGGIITCGIATAIASSIALIESIIYLTKTPDEFKRLYIDKKTSWF